MPSLFEMPWATVGMILAVTVATQVVGTEYAPATATAAKNSTSPEVERAAATWVLDHFGVVTVKTEEEKTERCVAVEHLPTEPFNITEINLYQQDYNEADLSLLRH